MYKNISVIIASSDWIEKNIGEVVDNLMYYRGYKKGSALERSILKYKNYHTDKKAKELIDGILKKLNLTSKPKLGNPTFEQIKKLSEEGTFIKISFEAEKTKYSIDFIGGCPDGDYAMEVQGIGFPLLKGYAENVDLNPRKVSFDLHIVIDLLSFDQIKHLFNKELDPVDLKTVFPNE